MRFSITVFLWTGKAIYILSSRKERIAISSQLSFQFIFLYKIFGLQQEMKCPFSLALCVSKKEKNTWYQLADFPRVTISVAISVFCIRLNLPTPHKLPFFFNKEQRMQRFFSPHGKSETLWVMCLKNILRFLKRKIIFLKMKIKCSPYTGFYIRGGYCPSSI